MNFRHFSSYNNVWLSISLPLFVLVRLMCLLSAFYGFILLWQRAVFMQRKVQCRKYFGRIFFLHLREMYVFDEIYYASGVSEITKTKKTKWKIIHGWRTEKKLHKFDLDLNDMYAIYPQRLILLPRQMYFVRWKRESEKIRNINKWHEFAIIAMKGEKNEINLWRECSFHSFLYFVCHFLWACHQVIIA